MLHPVDKITSSESLRPYLADGMAPRNYLIDKSSAKHLIPSSEEDKYYHEKFGDMTKLQLSETEMNALRSSGESNKSNKSTRLYTSKRPHPNDIFYFKVCFPFIENYLCSLLIIHTIHVYWNRVFPRRFNAM